MLKQGVGDHARDVEKGSAKERVVGSKGVQIGLQIGKAVTDACFHIFWQDKDRGRGRAGPLQGNLSSSIGHKLEPLLHRLLYELRYLPLPRLGKVHASTVLQILHYHLSHRVG